MTRINAAARLIASDNPQWFLDLTEQQQKDYLDDHPRSRLQPGAKQHRDKAETVNHGMSSPEVKKEIEYNKRQISNLRDDIKEIEDDGDDASRERKVLKDLLDDLRNLQKG